MDALSIARMAGAVVATALLLAGCSGAGESDVPLSASVSSEESVPVSPGDGEVVRMWIAPQKAECVGVAPMECLQVAYSEGGEQQLFYDSIAGFEYTAGTSYVIDVRVSEIPDPPADASSLSYTLVEVVNSEPQ